MQKCTLWDGFGPSTVTPRLLSGGNFSSSAAWLDELERKASGQTTRSRGSSGRRGQDGQSTTERIRRANQEAEGKCGLRNGRGSLAKEDVLVLLDHHAPPWTLDDFDIGRKLGEVALKAIKKAHLLSSLNEHLLRREIEIHSHLLHPNILQFYGWFSTTQKIYLILEIAPSGELMDKLNNGGLPEEIVSRYMKQIISAIRCCHRLNVMHRDLKPENILIDIDGNLKLADFGWAAHVPSDIANSVAAAADSNESNRVEKKSGESPSFVYLKKRRKTYCGTLDYLSPEICRREWYGKEVDVWCLGVLCYELATGGPPFSHEIYQRKGLNEGEARKQQQIDIQSADIQSRLLPSMSTEIRDFLVRALHKVPEQRMSTSQMLKHPFISKHNSLEDESSLDDSDSDVNITTTYRTRYREQQQSSKVNKSGGQISKGGVGVKHESQIEIEKRKESSRQAGEVKKSNGGTDTAGLRDIVGAATSQKQLQQNSSHTSIFKGTPNSNISMPSTYKSGLSAVLPALLGRGADSNRSAQLGLNHPVHAAKGNLKVGSGVSATAQMTKGSSGTFVPALALSQLKSAEEDRAGLKRTGSKESTRDAKRTESERMQIASQQLPSGAPNSKLQQSQGSEDYNRIGKATSGIGFVKGGQSATSYGLDAQRNTTVETRTAKALPAALDHPKQSHSSSSSGLAALRHCAGQHIMHSGSGGQTAPISSPLPRINEMSRLKMIDILESDGDDEDDSDDENIELMLQNEDDERFEGFGSGDE